MSGPLDTLPLTAPCKPMSGGKRALHELIDGPGSSSGTTREKAKRIACHDEPQSPGSALPHPHTHACTCMLRPMGHFNSLIS